MNQGACRKGATEFEAKCLEFLEEVAATGMPLVITKHGCPFVRIEPISSDEAQDLRGSVVAGCELTAPIDDACRADAGEI